MKTLEDLVRETKGDGHCSGRSTDELALGYLRYEALRKLSPRQFDVIHMRNTGGKYERFDDMIDELVLKNGNK